jgi:hypothetical protein
MDVTYENNKRSTRDGSGKLITVGDGVLLLLVAALAGTLFVVIPDRVLSRGTEVEVRTDDTFFGSFPLGKEMRVDVPGPLGTTVVRIRGGRASIESSPCPHGVCVHMGEIGAEGGVLVCVPNRVVVRVTGQRSDGLDAVSR